MYERVKAFTLMFLCTIFSASAQFFYKLGLPLLPRTISQWPLLFTDWFFIIGILCYGIGMIFLILAFRLGDVSSLFPLLSASYIWVAVISLLFFNETLGIVKISGMLVIIAGIIVVGREKSA